MLFIFIWCCLLCFFLPIVTKAYAMKVSFDDVESIWWISLGFQNCKLILNCPAPFLHSPNTEAANTKVQEYFISNSFFLQIRRQSIGICVDEETVQMLNVPFSCKYSC